MEVPRPGTESEPQLQPTLQLLDAGPFYFILFYFIILFYYFCFLGLHPWHIKIPRLGVKSELAYTTAIATPDLSHVCELHHSSRQRRVLNPLSEARDQTCHLMFTSQIHFLCATVGTPRSFHPLSRAKD